jgi:hypothetical protein
LEAYGPVIRALRRGCHSLPAETMFHVKTPPRSSVVEPVAYTRRVARTGWSGASPTPSSSPSGG